MLEFPEPLIQGKFIKRYKRFFADIRINEQVVTAHVPNTGSLKTCLFPDQICFVSPSKDPQRKLKYTLEMTSSPEGDLIGVNTQWPNKFVHELWKQKKVPHWKSYTGCKPEIKITPDTRIDFQLFMEDSSSPPLYVEVKNVTYLNLNHQAQFPDAVTERGQKHLKELMRLHREGFGAEVVFLIQRNGIQSFGPCDEIDPEYGRLFRQAFEQGVRMTPILTRLSPKGIEFLKILDFKI